MDPGNQRPGGPLLVRVLVLGVVSDQQRRDQLRQRRIKQRELGNWQRPPEQLGVALEDQRSSGERKLRLPVGGPLDVLDERDGVQRGLLRRVEQRAVDDQLVADGEAADRAERRQIQLQGSAGQQRVAADQG